MDGNKHCLYPNLKRKAQDGFGWQNTIAVGFKNQTSGTGLVYRRFRANFNNRTILYLHRQNKWLTKEPRVGIARDTVSRQAKEGMFYSMELLRFHSTHVTEPPAMVCYLRKAPDFSAVKYISLGGKQKPWIVEEYADSDLCSVPPGDIVKAVENTGIARLILLSPAIWSRITPWLLGSGNGSAEYRWCELYSAHCCGRSAGCSGRMGYCSAKAKTEEVRRTCWFGALSPGGCRYCPAFGRKPAHGQFQR